VLLAAVVALQIETPNSILFNSERNCWPYMNGAEELVPGGRDTCARLVPLGTTSTFR
jgi:hypothetical protein